MRIVTDPRLPNVSEPGFKARLFEHFRNIAVQLNQLSEGSIHAVTNATTAAPTSGTYNQGDKVWNSQPTEQGSASSKYVVLGWVCTSAGTPGTWLPIRTLTGN